MSVGVSVGNCVGLIVGGSVGGSDGILVGNGVGLAWVSKGHSKQSLSNLGMTYN